MLLRNYDNFMVAFSRVTPSDKYLSNDTKTFGDGFINAKTTSGYIRTIYNARRYGNPFAYFSESSNGTASGEGGSNLICGSGDTIENYDDYSLATPFSGSQITSVSGVQVISEPIYNESDKTWTFSYSRNFKAIVDLKLDEATGTDTRVKEIGVLYSFNPASGYAEHALVYRKVLDKPLSVEAGQQFTLTFTTTVSANPNKPADYDANAAVTG